MRSADLRRSTLFVAGADADIHAQALRVRPDMLIQDLEDGTPAQLRQAARQRSAALFAAAKQRGMVVAVRINTLESIGREDLAAVIAAQPQVVFLPKCANGAHIKEATLSCRRAGSETSDFMHIKMQDVLISSFQQTGNGDVPTESISFVFGALIFQYTPQKPDGTLDAPITTGWDLRANRAV